MKNRLTPTRVRAVISWSRSIPERPATRPAPPARAHRGLNSAAAGEGIWGATAVELIIMNTVVAGILSIFLFNGGVEFPKDIKSWQTIYVAVTAWLILITVVALVYTIIGAIKHDVEIEDKGAKIIRWGTAPLYLIALLALFVGMFIGIGSR